MRRTQQPYALLGEAVVELKAVLVLVGEQDPPGTAGDLVGLSR
ncbi:hypothetical protein [Yinghuangia soli]|nr:hypothetical protein [Yinghuangia soli]